MIGTYINVAAVVGGTCMGRVVGRRMPDRLHQTITNSVGLIIIGIGILDIIGLKNGPLVFASVIVGALIGELTRIEDGIAWIGLKAQERFQPDNSTGDFSKAFVTTSLLFCVGPLTILGSLEDGLRGDYSKLLVKSVLDGFTSMAISASLGWGVLLSALTVLFIQGAITLSAVAIKPLLTPIMITEMSAVGGIILLAMGLNILGVTKIRTASLLPALLIELICASKWG
jgi:uncharacterized membrane protein YqgA involved in biofilm formation